MNATPPKRPERVARSDHEHVDKISTGTTIAVLFVVALLVYELQWILLPFVVSGLLAYVCTPLIEWLTAHSRLPRWLWATGLFLILLLIGVILGTLGIPPLIRETTQILGNFQTIIRTLAEGVIGDQSIHLSGRSMDAAQIAQAITDGIQNWLSQDGKLATLGGIAFTGFFGIIVTLVLLLYFLLSGPQIAQGLFWLPPPKQRPLIRHIWSILDPVLKRYFIGIAVVTLYAAIAAYIGLGIALGLPHAVTLAILTGILEMIPMIGPGAAAILVGLVAVHYAKGIGAIIAYAIYAAVLRLSINDFFGPLVLGNAARLHAVLIIFCFMAGGLTFGVIGLILAIPTALAIKVTLAILYDESPRLDAGRDDAVKR